MRRSRAGARGAAKPYDSTTKDLVDAHPLDWLRLAGLAADGEVQVVDADLSTVNAQSDKVIRIVGAMARIIHFELQAGPAPRLAMRILRYHALLDYRHRLPVQSILVLLRPEADSPRLDGLLRRALPGGADDHIVFRYDVLRLWEIPVEEILKGGLGTLPLALLARLGKSRPPDVVRELVKRIDREAEPSEADTLLTSAFILSGMRFAKGENDMLFLKIKELRESSGYQSILEEGRDEGIKLGISQGIGQGELNEARQIVLRLGKKRFGEADGATRAIVEGLTDVEVLHQIIERILDAKDWSEALGPPAMAKPRRRGKKPAEGPRGS